MSKVKPIAERLLARVTVTETGCWQWTGSCGRAGYGRFCIRVGGKKTTPSAHRLSYATFIGPIPTGAIIMHSCDNRKCINPAHLSAGTHSANARDAFNKGRRGKLGAAGVALVRIGGRSDAELGRQLGVTRQCIRAVRVGRNWADNG